MPRMFFVSLKILFTSGQIISYFGALGAVKIQNDRLRPGASFRTAGRTNENPRRAQTSHSRQFPHPSATAPDGTRPAVYIHAKRRPPHSSMTSTFCRLKNPRRAAMPSIVRSTASSTDRSSPRTRPYPVADERRATASGVEQPPERPCGVTPQSVRPAGVPSPGLEEAIYEHRLLVLPPADVECAFHSAALAGRQGPEQQFDRDAAHAPSPSGPQHSARTRRRLTSASVLSACSIIPLRSFSGMSSRTPSVPDATPSREAK